MEVLIIGGGGREHAMAWKVSQSPLVNRVHIAPGNAGTAKESKALNVAIDAGDIGSLVKYASQQKIDLTIVGPEVPLVQGIVDRFDEKGLRCFGPKKVAAQLEGSKEFTKRFLESNNIPTARYASFSNTDSAYQYIDNTEPPIVVKADGLAAGKGVIIAYTRQEAKDAVRSMLLEEQFGSAGSRVVIEEFLEGEEASFICMVDGEDVLPLASSQDHKAAHDGDKGPNTGGMGAYSPAPVLDASMCEQVMKTVIYPTVRGLLQQGIHYTGFLYAGLMIDSQRIPFVLEYNCRLGDPETQPILMRLESDLVEMCLNALDGKLNRTVVNWDDRTALGVVVAAGGYPGAYKTGAVISGLEVADSENVKVFHAGTQLDDGNVVVSGGRVLCVTALAEDIAKAQSNAYGIAERISFVDMYYRKDIGYRAVARLKGVNS